MIQEEIKKGIDLYYKKAKELGDYLTEHPEISGQEENSSRYIMGFLEKQGYEILSPYGTVPYSFLMPVDIPLAVRSASWGLWPSGRPVRICRSG